MIIALCGRKGSGKSMLSEICVQKGYERLYFALPLKQLIAHLINGTIDDVNKQKDTYFEKELTEDELQYLANETQIPLDVVKEKNNNRIYHNTREMLQYIGTEIIRAYNKDWHVNKIKELIENGKDYVIDDVRFPNEQLMLELKNAVFFFVVRPKLDNISNHSSETSLRWQNFNNIIINDKTPEYLKFLWESFIDNGIIDSLHSKNMLENKLIQDNKYMQELMNNTQPFNMYDSLFISKYIFEYEAKFYTKINLENIAKIEPFANKIYRVYYKDDNIEIITNPLMIEDIKFLVTNE